MKSHYGSNKLLALAHQQLSLYNSRRVAMEEETAAGYNKAITLTRTGFLESVTQTVLERKRAAAAAVLVCIFEDDCGELRVILTVRSRIVSSHPGEVSLPGGRREDGDKDDEETATREAEEEIGLNPSLVDVIAVLEPFFCKHTPKVTPVVGIIKSRQAFKATSNPAEVEALFEAPLQMFIKENGRVEERDWKGEKYLMPCFEYEAGDKKYEIWGLTAAILIKVAAIVYQQPPPFLDRNPSLHFPRL
ncbi:Nudix hydrolase 22, chloroplastic [Linum grandiflorum]